MKWIDLPPIWLAACLLLAWLCGTDTAILGAAFQRGFGLVFLLVGFGLMGAAIAQMFHHRTTVVPHMNASTLVTTGVFRISRNPIYLADALILTGCILRWNAYLAIPLVPLFMYIILVRHIRPEEARLRSGFGETFDLYCATTCRWLCLR